MFRSPFLAALLFITAGYSLAQGQNALLSPADTQQAATRASQLMESTSAAVAGLLRTSDVLRQNTQATIADLSRSQRDPALTLQLINEINAFLALADSLPRPEYFPPTAAQQFVELRDLQQKLDRHFHALLTRIQNDEHASDADPNNLRHYAPANARLMAPSPALPRIVLLGDGATEQWRLNEYFTGQDYVNRGITGQTTTQILARMLADVVALHPLAVVVLAGSDDLAAGMNPSAIADDLVMIGDVAKAHSVQPIFASVLPVSGAAAKVRTPEAIRKLNTWIRDYCIRENFVYIDYYKDMADDKGMMKAELSDDGVTPNSRGYRAMSPVLTDGIDRVRNLLGAPEDQNKIRKRLLPSGPAK